MVGMGIQERLVCKSQLRYRYQDGQPGGNGGSERSFGCAAKRALDYEVRLRVHDKLHRRYSESERLYSSRLFGLHGNTDCVRDIPEFGYSADTGKFRTLEKTNGAWRFEENADADHNGRIHFTPLWFPDGEYVVSANVSDFWTPAGMIHASVNCVPITIQGSAYDDWFLGR